MVGSKHNPITFGKIEWALEAALENRNSHIGNLPPRFTIEDLRASKYYEQVKQLAEEWGYDT